MEGKQMPAITCALVSSKPAYGIAVLDVDAACKETRDGLCICRLCPDAADAGKDLLFFDNCALLCHSPDDWAREVLCFDSQLFNACNFGLMGERVLSFFQLLSAAHYRHSPEMTDHAPLERAWQNIWSLRGRQGRSVENAVMASLWNVLYLLEPQIDAAAEPMVQVDWHKRTRLMPLLLYLHENYASEITLSDMAQRVNMSAPNLSAVFRRVMGIPPVEYLIRLRLQNAASQLKSTDRKIIDIAQDCGFTSISNFIKAFHRYYGVSPAQYRSAGRR